MRLLYLPFLLSFPLFYNISLSHFLSLCFALFCFVVMLFCCFVLFLLILLTLIFYIYYVKSKGALFFTYPIFSYWISNMDMDTQGHAI